MRDFKSAIIIGITFGAITIGVLAIQPKNDYATPACVDGNTNLQYLWSPAPSKLAPAASIQPVINCIGH